MRPGTDKSALKVIQQDQMTVGELEALLRETNYNGFPVVVSEQDMLVAGFCTRYAALAKSTSHSERFRRDLQAALRNARKTHQYVTTNSKVYFSSNVPDFEPSGSMPAPLRLRKLMDMVG